MKTISIRDLRQRWPEAEAALQVEDEIIITRDSKPVARLVGVSNAEAKRPRWDANDHGRWQKKISGGKISRSDTALAESRADRVFSKKRKRWNPGEHGRWVKKVYGNKKFKSSDEQLAADRADRKLI